MWVPRYINTKENDMANQLAKQDGDMHVSGLDSFFSTSIRQLKKERQE